jgi:outer membrane lipoprotein-sorting protein
MKTLIAFLLVVFTAAILRADLTAASSVEETLDALCEVGKDLKSFAADVKLNESDLISQDTTTRTGKVWYQKKAEGDARLRVTFDKRTQDGATQEQKIDYLLDKGWLVDRNYARKLEINRQVLRPGEKINLLKLGEGPFPLPIGQKREDVLKQFEVKHVELATNEMPNAMHLMLTPKPGTQFDRKFTSIDVWVDFKTSMPRRIETIDKNGTMSRGTDLENVKLNVEIPDADFKLPEVRGGDWQRRDEPFND